MSKEKIRSETVKAVITTTKPRWSVSKTVLLVAVVAILVSALIFLLTQRDDQANTGAIDDKKYQQALGDGNKLRSSQNYDEAKQVWQQYVESSASNQEKYKAYIQIASLDETKGDYQAALQSYREAEKLGTGEWRAENEAIARCSENIGDLQTAITYYQRSLDTFPGGESYNGDMQYYRSKIEKLKQALEIKQNG